MDASNFSKLDDAFAELIEKGVNGAPFPKYLGLVYEEVRLDYARMRLPHRPELNQTANIYHGGAVASLIDTVVAGAVISGVEGQLKRMVTVDMHIHYMGAAAGEDLIAHGAVRRRGRKMVFLEADVVGATSKKQIAHGELSYMLIY